MLLAGPLATHGLGGQTDLPIPFPVAVIGGAWALTITFAVVAFAWRRPRFAEPVDVGRPPAIRSWLTVVGTLVTVWVYGALFLGSDQLRAGAVGFFYTWLWVGLVPLALVAGHVWRDLSPWRGVQRLLGRALGRPQGYLRYPSWLGYWPAAAGLLAFVWLELCSPDPGSTTSVRWWLGTYAVVTVVGGVLFGPRWFNRADPFDVYSAVVARLSPLVVDRRWHPHNPLRTLPTVPLDHGLIAIVAVLLGSTAFDSFGASQEWQLREMSTLGDTVALLVFVLVVGAAFVAAAMATGGVTRAQRRALPGDLVHTLVPIVVGYVFAHYLTYLVEKGQRAVIDLLALDATPSFWLSERPMLVGTLKVVFVVGGHILAVLAAHDRALLTLPRAHRLTGQLAMMVLMVAYTFMGLYLLLSV
ncbi:hypothetical protein EHW97_02565 [Aeromicrobium camelliae]|uniref:Fenitrothion hydrolase n=1 Tax=Aeromicrobium camelliae TaxID=1538144 RepID=A0A3N6X862_9ACTN|nr:hypothetical protein [Aeromicrobium camelliae]RQN09818.1 hypothetical protein EHW97_02565 [Aeromicrobium camelliae]